MQGKGNYVILGNRIIESDHSHGSIRIPIKTGLQFQRAFSAFFDRLPLCSYASTRGAHVNGDFPLFRIR